MLQGRDIHLALSGREILRGVSLALPAGQVTALIGPNGAGKSLLLDCLTGRRKPGSGSVTLDGQPLSALAPGELALRRAVLEQEPRAAAATRALELAMLGIPRAIPPAEARGMAAAALAEVGLPGIGARPVGALSGGERHRVHLARALCQHRAGRRLTGRPGVLLLDEPTASLDLAHQAAVLGLARAEAAAGSAVLAVLHDLGLAAAAADRILLLAAGRLVAEGPPRAVLTPGRLAAVYGLPVALTELADGTLGVLPRFRSRFHDEEGRTACSSP